MPHPKTKPLVSVIIPTYNVSDYVEMTLASVLTQSYSNLEVICVDDCSEDDTVEKIRRIDDKRIKVLVNALNSGAGKTRTSGLRAAHGKYIALLDSDDLWTSDKIERQVSFIERERAAAVYTYYDVIDKEGYAFDKVDSLPDRVSYARMLEHCYIRTSCLLYDADKVGRDIEFPDVRKRQDYLFFLELLRRVGEARLLPEITCSYRVHSGSVSSNKLKNVPFQWNVYRKHEKLGLLSSIGLLGRWFARSGLVVIRRMALSMKHGPAGRR